LKFLPLPLQGAFLIEPDRVEDERGFFARTYCRNEFAARGLNPDLVQCSVSYNRKNGTLRGMHFQKKPHQEDKLVRCTSGSIFDVIVDMRENSPTCRQWTGVELSAASRASLYVPKGFAHGFITLEDDTEVFYQISEFFHPESAQGIRWDDPAIGIDWARRPSVISEKDCQYALLDEMRGNG